MATISAKGLSDQLSLLAKKIDVTELEAQFADVGSFLETSAASTLASIDLGAVQGGLQSLTQDLDNASDVLLTQMAPTITKLDASAAELIGGLQTQVSSVDLTNINKVFGDASSSVSDMFEDAQPALEAATGMLQEVIADGSVEAQLATLKNLTGETVDKLTPVLNELVNAENISGSIDDFIKELDIESISGEISGKLDQAMDVFDTNFTKALGGLNSGNLLKDIVELKTFNIQNAISGINLADVNVLGVTNTILSGKISEARNAMVSGLEIPADLTNLTTGVVPTFDTTKNLQTFLTRFDPKTAIQTESIAKLQGSLNGIDTNITDDMGKLSSTVTPNDEDTPENKNPTTDINKSVSNYDAFSIINSKEELIKYFQSATRELSTLEIRWSGLTLDDAQTTAFELAGTYETYYTVDYGSRIKGGPSHFYIRKDGTIETMRPLNTDYFDGFVGAGSNTAKHGVSVMINAGYSTYLNADGSYPDVELDPKSVTSQQMKSVHRIVSAFYSFLPAGDVYSRQDLDDTGSVIDPGFSMSEIIQKPPYNSKNSDHHIDVDADNAFLPPSELGAAEAQANASKAAEQSEKED